MQQVRTLETDSSGYSTRDGGVSESDPVSPGLIPHHSVWDACTLVSVGRRMDGCSILVVSDNILCAKALPLPCSCGPNPGLFNTLKLHLMSR